MPVSRHARPGDAIGADATGGARIGRSSFLRWGGKVGLGLVGAVTAAVKSPPLALAAPAPSAAGARPMTASHCWPNTGPFAVGCCALACPSSHYCSGTGSSYTCPSGYNKKQWSCCDSDGRVRFCGECTTGGNCTELATFICSETWKGPTC